MVLRGRNDAQFVCHMPIGTTSAVKNYTLSVNSSVRNTHTHTLWEKRSVVSS